jgi:hypothetical protein
MQAIGKFGVKQSIHKTVPGDPTAALKSVRDNPRAKMGASAFARSGVAHMQVRFVDDFDENGVERRCQTRDDSFPHVQASLSR